VGFVVVDDRGSPVPGRKVYDSITSARTQASLKGHGCRVAPVFTYENR